MVTWKHWFYTLFTIAVLLLIHGPSQAHANLIQSDPPANAVLPDPPQEIRLWFTEPLEPDFSQITLRDQAGSPLDSFSSFIDTADAKQMVVPIDHLPDGLYTVSWRVVSTADGHSTEGSFSFTVGAAVTAGTGAAEVTADTIPLVDSTVRWLNFVSMAFAIGCAGFYLFVWKSVFPAPHNQIEQFFDRLMWLGWLALGITAVAMLLLQATIVTGQSLTSLILDPALFTVIRETRFGHLWLLRMNLWIGAGFVLWIVRPRSRSYSLVLVLIAGILLTTSLFSHASAAPDSVAAVSADWLH